MYTHTYVNNNRLLLFVIIIILFPFFNFLSCCCCFNCVYVCFFCIFLHIFYAPANGFAQINKTVVANTYIHTYLYMQ